MRADLVPERFVAEGILESLQEAALEGASVLVARARGSRAALVEGLRGRGALVDELLLYEAVAQPAGPELVEAALSADAVTFTASSTVAAFMALLDDDARARLADGGPAVVSIGPITSETARAAGLSVAAEAPEHTIPGLVDVLAQTLGR